MNLCELVFKNANTIEKQIAKKIKNWMRIEINRVCCHNLI